MVVNQRKGATSKNRKNENATKVQGCHKRGLLSTIVAYMFVAYGEGNSRKHFVKSSLWPGFVDNFLVSLKCRAFQEIL